MWFLEVMPAFNATGTLYLSSWLLLIDNATDLKALLAKTILKF